jgi:hypothetical protein
MFTEAIARAVQAARTDELDHLAREIWRAHGAGVLDDAGAQAAAEAVQARRALERIQTAPGRKDAPGAAARPRRPRSPEKQASIERRRRLSASGPLPPHLACKFTVSEQAVLRIVGDECRDHGSRIVWGIFHLRPTAGWAYRLFDCCWSEHAAGRIVPSKTRARPLFDAPQAVKCQRGCTVRGTSRHMMARSPSADDD